jgi:NADPH:quinone reductase-like Zn-dependent oxidoreductase
VTTDTEMGVAPTLYRRIVISRAGGPDRLALVEGPVPQPGPGEVLVANEAVGVAFADVLIREGLYPGVPLPATPGYEVVGRVVALGAGVTAPERGARVAALTVRGGYASHVAVRAADCVAVPDGLSSAQAAALVLNGLTAYQMLTRCVARGSLERILVWGAAGGVGSVLLDLARHFGIAAYGVASAGRLGFVEARGAIPIDRSAGDVGAAIGKRGGVDAAFDGVGGANVARSVAALRSGGTVVMFGVQGGLPGGRRNPLALAATFLRSPVLQAHRLFMRNIGLKGYLIEEWKRTHPHFYREDLAAMLALATDGHILPELHATLPLECAADAHRLINAGAQTGKIVLLPQEAGS